MSDYADMYGVVEAVQWAFVCLAIVLVVSCISWILAKQGMWHTSPFLMVFVNAFIVVAAVTGAWVLYRALSDPAYAHEVGVEGLKYSPTGYWGRG